MAETEDIKTGISVAKTEELIQFVRENQFLWDTRMPDYRDIIKHTNTWTSISEKLDVKGVDGK